MQQQQQVTLCGKRLTGLRHVCAFFESEEEMYDILGPYLKEGIDQGERVITIVESEAHPRQVEHLKTQGVDVECACRKQQLQLLASEDTYLKDQIFVMDRMYRMVEQAILEAERSEFKRVRTLGDMVWALKNLEGTEDLMAYEAKLNLMAPHHDCTLLCAYDINRFSGRVIADALATHSHVLLGGQIFENPHYMDPIVYLQRHALRRNRDSSLARASA